MTRSTHPRPHSPCERLAGLARKYRALVSLREAHARGDGVASRPALRALAEEFPSALREIDRAPMSLLVERLARVEAAAVDAARVEPWMEWFAAYHSLMAATLATRRALGRTSAVEPARALALAARATERAGLTLDADYVRAVAAPPGGRLSTLVFERLGAHFAVAPEALRAGLFPS